MLNRIHVNNSVQILALKVDAGLVLYVCGVCVTMDMSDGNDKQQVNQYVTECDTMGTSPTRIATAVAVTVLAHDASTVDMEPLKHVSDGADHGKYQGSIPGQQDQNPLRLRAV